MDFSPDSKKLAYIQTDSRIAVVDLASGQVRYLEPPTRAEQENIQFAPDGRRFALCAGRAGKWAVEVWDALTGKVQRSLPHPQRPHHPAWHPDGRMLATSCDDYLIRLWDVASDQPPRKLQGHKTYGIYCAFTRTGDGLLSSDWSGVLRVWEPSSGRQLLSFPAGGNWFLRVSPNDCISARHVADMTKLQLLRLHPGLEYRTIDLRGGTSSQGIDCLKAHPGGKLLAGRAADNSVVLVDLSAGRQVATLIRPGMPLLWEPAGDLLTCGPKGLLRWPVHAEPAEQGPARIGPPERLLPGNRWASAYWGSSDNRQIIAIPDHERGAVVVHRGPPTRTVLLQPKQKVSCCAVSPDGCWVATGIHGSTDGPGAQVWNAATGELVKKFPVPGHCGVAFSPDGRWLLTTSGGCRLWEVGSWNEWWKVGGANGCFSPDGRHLAVVDSPGAIRLVRLQDRAQLTRLEAPEQTLLVPRCFTPDGTRLIAIGVDTQALHVWDLRRILAGLARLGLDWDAPPYPEAAADAPAGAPGPLEVQVVGADVLAAPRDPIGLNNLAWRLVTGPPDERDPARALQLIQEALKQQPKNAHFLNTLGVVQYRNGQYAAAVVALEQSLSAGKGEFAGFDLFFLAMCHARLGAPAKAHDCFDRAVKWCDGKKGLSDQHVQELQAFRAEAEAVLNDLKQTPEE
jgi:WD40 repeat protein